MSSYRTVKDTEVESVITDIKGLEPLILDGKLVAIIAGPLRIYADKGQLLVSKQETVK